MSAAKKHKQVVLSLEQKLEGIANNCSVWLKSRWAWPSLIRIFTYPHGFWNLLATAVRITEGLLYIIHYYACKYVHHALLCMQISTYCMQISTSCIIMQQISEVNSTVNG